MAEPAGKGSSIIFVLMWLLNLWRAKRGQDLIDYALLGGFVAVAIVAIMPGIANSIITIFSLVTSVMGSATVTS